MKNNNEARSLRGARAVGLLIGVLCSAAAAADVTINPEIGVAGIYSDNIDLDPPGLEESEFIGELRPAIRIAVTSPRVEGNLDYQMESYFFENSDRDQTFHQLDGNLESELISELLYFDATARSSQTVIDPLELVPFSNFVITENRADYTTWQVNPYFERDVGGWTQIRLSYDYGDMRYRNVDEAAVNVQDFTDKTLNFTMAALPEDRTLYWELRYNNERVEYETAASVEYELASAMIGFRVTPSLQLIASGGRESDLRENGSSSQLKSDVWYTGFRWRPQRHEMEVTFGERFFGRTYSASWAYTGDTVVTGFDYSESPLTVGQQLFDVPVLTTPLPGDPGSPLTAQTPEIYLSELTTAWFAIVARRNSIQFTAYRDRREFFETGLEEEESGVLVDWDLRLGPRTTLFMDLTWQRVGYQGSERNDEFGTGTLGVARQLGMATWITLTARHGQRTSDAVPISPLYEENGAMLEVSHRFGRPPAETEEAGAERYYRGRRGDSVLRGR